MRLHLFNPDNDLALANFSPGFTPPATIQGMVSDLQSLPNSWVEPGDLVLTDDLPHEQLASITEVCPWGWSPAICHRLRSLGLSPSLLPSDGQLQEIRRLSSRKIAVQLLKELRKAGLCEGFESEFCSTPAQVEAALARWPRTILKAPWSGSGKGLRYGHGGREDTLRGWYKRILALQGGVVVEPIYNKVYDLAMEFWSDGEGNVTYQGLSLFDTHPNGAYHGNHLLPESEKEAWLAQFVSPTLTQNLRQWLERRLGKILANHYRGYLGIDMMLVGNAASSTHNSTLVLHPMVELNLRMTMGMVSVLLSRRLPQDFRGIFRLDYFPSTDALHADNTLQRLSAPTFQVLAMGKHYRAYITDNYAPTPATKLQKNEP